MAWIVLNLCHSGARTCLVLNSGGSDDPGTSSLVPNVPLAHYPSSDMRWFFMVLQRPGVNVFRASMAWLVLSLYHLGARTCLALNSGRSDDPGTSLIPNVPLALHLKYLDWTYIACTCGWASSPITFENAPEFLRHS